MLLSHSNGGGSHHLCNQKPDKDLTRNLTRRSLLVSLPVPMLTLHQYITNQLYILPSRGNLSCLLCRRPRFKSRQACPHLHGGWPDVALLRPCRIDCSSSVTEIVSTCVPMMMIVIATQPQINEPSDCHIMTMSLYIWVVLSSKQFPRTRVHSLKFQIYSRDRFKFRKKKIHCPNRKISIRKQYKRLKPSNFKGYSPVPMDILLAKPCKFSYMDQLTV